MDDVARRDHLRRIAPLGGRARAAQLTPARRREIARQGFQAMVDRHFGGDRVAALAWLTAKGLTAQDRWIAEGLASRGGPLLHRLADDPGPRPPARDDQDDQDRPQDLPF
jgi:hypothetical protein